MRTPSLAKRFPDLVLSGELLLRNPITGIAACCPRAASGHAAAAPPTSEMKLRRFMTDMGFSPHPVRPVSPHPKPTTQGSAGPWGRPEMS